MLRDLTALVHQNVTKLLLSSVSMAALLFTASEPGQLMPVDPAYLYTDTTGTTPVTATGQSVALQLDKSKGLALGPELVTNGDFATDTGWTLGGNWSISGGTLNGAAATSYSYIQAIGLNPSKTYRLLVSVTVSIGSVAINLGGINEVAFTSSGQKTATLLLDPSAIPFVYVSGSNFTGTIDNISVRELPGNHDTQPTVGSRPIYGKHPANGYRNMLASSEDFSAAVWNKSVTVTADQTLAPDGTMSAEKITKIAVAYQSVYRTSIPSTVGQAYTSSAYFKADTFSRASIAVISGTSFVRYWFDLATKTVGGATGTDTTGYVNSAVQDVGNGWLRCSLSITSQASTVETYFYPDKADVAVAGSAYIWGAQLETGSTATTYQRTGASSGVAWPAPPSYDITEAGQPDLHYLHYNGVSSFMVSPTITPGIDKAQVFVGARKLSDAAVGIVAETSVAANTNNGAFYLGAPALVAANYTFSSNGTVPQVALYTNAAVAAPNTSVVTGLGDVSGDRATLRVNGVQVAQNTTDQGTGNYLAYPIYTGRRGGTSLPFNGLVYSKIIRFGPNLTADQIAATERWMAQRTGVSL